jgi:hypothetical protein
MDFASTMDCATLAITNRQMRASTRSHYKQKDKMMQCAQDKLTSHQRSTVPLQIHGYSNAIPSIFGRERIQGICKVVNEGDYPKDDYEAAIAWNKYVDGKDILPKLPSHLRIHRDRWDRNQ